MRFENQVAIITGAASGLGRAYAITLAERGASIVLIDRKYDVDDPQGKARRQALFQTQADVEGLGSQVLVFEMDVACAESVVKTVNEVIEMWGRIDVLINNAGIHEPCAFENLSFKTFQRQMDVDLNGSFYFAKAVWPVMKRQEYGRIVMTTGASALYGDMNEVAFSASKMALVGLVNSLCIEGAYYDIHVNSFAPQAVTAMTNSHLADSVKPLFTKESVTACMIFLASKYAPNGQHLLAAAGSISHGQFAEYAPKFFKHEECNAEKILQSWSDIYQAMPVKAHDCGESQILEWARRSAAQHHVGLD
ncbi:SDR family NAD(P)-dependent oxidoreductase [Shewanella gelidii]|uniref:Short-chain dehydrogenase/reductase n=1 Tax=Shewanella gelidii TaxID=1642821 RepID=A0A917JL11_9GAMM|nr:SDR family NAD(P)-dependent oxidoreductase [Shewanella gelidii]MCL1097357.1 SDR family NAD(P)-dependent oxidoreductase [Shewanella gelidii]GGI74513.1 short-chain dehydrogenase/reductase [Shewanella gelidii]